MARINANVKTHQFSSTHLKRWLPLGIKMYMHMYNIHCKYVDIHVHVPEHLHTHVHVLVWLLSEEVVLGTRTNMYTCLAAQ